MTRRDQTADSRCEYTPPALTRYGKLDQLTHGTAQKAAGDVQSAATKAPN